MSLGVYVHLAFCPYLCPYCDFVKESYRGSVAQRYMEAVLVEIERRPREPAATVFLGGGTPNTYDAQTIASLLGRIDVQFPSVRPRETTIELNPDLLKPGDCEAYCSAGVTRVSLGVQSFNDMEVQVLGRRHRFDDVERAVRSARAAGIPSVSIDLMFAIPGQTTTTWCESLDRAIALDVDHVSTYGLQVEEGTPFARWREREPQAFLDDDAGAFLYEVAIERLAQAGFEQYELSNFARSGHRCVHNENYWNNGEYLGFGAGAASYRNGIRSASTRSIPEYMEAVSRGAPIPGESECLEGERRAGEAIMLALRTAQGVRLDAFKERYGVDVLECYARIVGKYERAGLLERSDGAMRLTRRGRFLANDVCGAFLAFA
jgi:oxygen-independent coproporphyrinogen-3 oxidase